MNLNFRVQISEPQSCLQRCILMLPVYGCEFMSLYTIRLIPLLFSIFPTSHFSAEGTSLIHRTRLSRFQISIPAMHLQLTLPILAFASAATAVDFRDYDPQPGVQAEFLPFFKAYVLSPSLSTHRPSIAIPVPIPTNPRLPTTPQTRHRSRRWRRHNRIHRFLPRRRHADDSSPALRRRGAHPGL